MGYLAANAWLAAVGWFIATTFWLGWIDYRTKLLPNRIVGIALSGQILLVTLVVGLENPGGPWQVWVPPMLGLVSMVAIYAFIHLLSRGQFGMGDVKFSAQIGLMGGWLGSQTWLAMFFAPFILAGSVSLLLLVARKLRSSDHLAFGPFMSGGAVLALLLGAF